MVSAKPRVIQIDLVKLWDTKQKAVNMEKTL